MAPTLEGMVTLSQDKKTVTIGIVGLYKIIATLNWSSQGCTADDITIYVNGSIIQKRYSASGSYGPGTVETIMDLKKGDTIKFYAGCISTHKTDPQWNSFSIQKL